MLHVVLQIDKIIIWPFFNATRANMGALTLANYSFLVYQ